jgi:hypothetical protein
MLDPAPQCLTGPFSRVDDGVLGRLFKQRITIRNHPSHKSSLQETSLPTNSERTGRSISLQHHIHNTKTSIDVRFQSHRRPIMARCEALRLPSLDTESFSSRSFRFVWKWREIRKRTHRSGNEVWQLVNRFWQSQHALYTLPKMLNLPPRVSIYHRRSIEDMR